MVYSRETVKNNEELLKQVVELEKQEDWIGAVKCLEKAAETEACFGKITFTLWVECWWVLVEAECLGLRELTKREILRLFNIWI